MSEITHTYIYAIRLQCDLHNFMRQYNLDVIISSFKYSMKMNMLLTKYKNNSLAILFILIIKEIKCEF
ncbi:hypothetical protein T03_946 [Trichinella britovi]|uniref:Uncharacterized protein n=1 Tax=Trichinella britovi TaxID=45882 RepID=A0A0V1D8N1_TRIBR|nr:hypothetical protein T03_946 [Trichinella britovi]